MRKISSLIVLILVFLIGCTSSQMSSGDSSLEQKALRILVESSDFIEFKNDKDIDPKVTSLEKVSEELISQKQEFWESENKGTFIAVFDGWENMTNPYLFEGKDTNNQDRGFITLVDMTDESIVNFYAIFIVKQ